MREPVSSIVAPIIVPVNPVTGCSLGHSKLNCVGRAFLGADLYVGARQLIKPTIAQAAYLAGVNKTYVKHALHRLMDRQAIEAGFIPLIPSNGGNGHSNSNGSSAEPSEGNGNIEDAVAPRQEAHHLSASADLWVCHHRRRLRCRNS